MNFYHIYKKYFNPNISESINYFLYLCIDENEYIRENSIKLYIKSKHSKTCQLKPKYATKATLCFAKKGHYKYTFITTLTKV